jgi:hypothetical protein
MGKLEEAEAYGYLAPTAWLDRLALDGSNKPL